MHPILIWLRGMRASNLVFLFAAPVIIWLLATSRNYGPALVAVLGIEEDAPALLAAFAILATASVAGVVGAIKLIRALRPDQTAAVVARQRRQALWAFGMQAVLLGLLSRLPVLDPYATSVALNITDPRNVDWILVVDQTFRLDPAFAAWFLPAAHRAVWLAALVALASAGFAALPQRLHRGLAGGGVLGLLLVANLCLAFFILMVAHAGFATGLMVTLRAAVFAYLGASVLGLVWAFCGRLKPSARASRIIAGVGIAAVAVAVWHGMKPEAEVVLAGTLEGRIGIVAGTPQGLADTVRYGDFLPEPPAEPLRIRSLASVEQALELIAAGTLSGAVLPVAAAGDLPVVWATSYLPTADRAIMISAAAFGFLSLVMVVIGRITGGHPVAVFADFFVDTIRGVPMLVIILYVGLPLAGAVKNGTGGAIDIDMMTRGIIAIAIGYSAYMAEIFRAGIEAIPKGQIEAARTLGLHEFQIARFIVIPQAIAIVLPALGNEFIAMLKDTSLVSILSVRDITQRMREFQAQSFLAFEPFNSAALIYVLLTLIAASGIKSLDRIVNRSRAPH